MKTMEPTEDQQTPLHGFMGGVAVVGTLRERCKALIILSHFDPRFCEEHPNHHQIIQCGCAAQVGRQ